MFLLLAGWIALLGAHLLNRVLAEARPLLRGRSGAPEGTSWADPNLPWGRGWTTDTQTNITHEGAFNTGMKGLSFFVADIGGATGGVEERYPWADVGWVRFDPVSRIQVGAHPDLVGEVRTTEALVGTLADPATGVADALSFVVLVTDDCPSPAWHALMRTVGIRGLVSAGATTGFGTQAGADSVGSCWSQQG